MADEPDRSARPPPRAPLMAAAAGAAAHEAKPPAPAQKAAPPTPTPAPAPTASATAPAAGGLADRLSGVVPRRPGTAADAGAGAGGGPAAPTAAVAPDVPKDVLELQGGAALTATPAVTEYLEKKGPAGGPVRARLSTLAGGTLNLRKTDEGLTTGPGKDYQALPLAHPFFLPLARYGIEPVLAVRVQGGLLEGHASAVVKGRLLTGPAELLGQVVSHAEQVGLAGVSDLKLPAVENRLDGPRLLVRASGLHFRLGGFLDATGSIGLANELVTFDAIATGTVPGLSAITVPVKRDAEGRLSGEAQVEVALKGFKGSVAATFAGGVVDVRGTVHYGNDTFDGEVTLVATDEKSAKHLTDDQVAAAQAKAAVPKPSVPGGEGAAAGPAPAAGPAEGSAAPAPAVAGPRPGPRVVAGWGTVNVRLAEWLSGEALVVVDHDGDVTLVGRITPKMTKPLFEQKDYVKPLPKLEVRALYGIPLVGNIFVFANIGLELLAKLGPATLDRMELTGTWSTKPEVLKNFGITGTLNISAFAGVRLVAEGGAGLELLGHDIKAGVALNALAGIRGYVEATPRIGYREVADPKSGKQGEFFIGGHMEIAAQPFLGLGGDLFVALVSPWWSPAPSHRWTWPLFQLEYPLPGEFGIGADVEHVLGSGKVPEVTFGEVAFSADKFMTDLMNDHVPGKTGRDEKKAGAWNEGPGAAPTKGGAKGGAKPGGGAPAAAPAAVKPGKPGPLKPGPLKPGKDAGEVPDPAKAKRWQGGLQAIGELAQQSLAEPYEEDEVREALAGIKKTYGFTRLAADREGDEWLIDARMSPETKKKPRLRATNHVYRGGPYNELGKAPAKKGGRRRAVKGTERNHMPAWKAVKDAQTSGGKAAGVKNKLDGISRYTAPAIEMDTADHRMTRSWGAGSDAVDWRKKQTDLLLDGKFRQAITMDVNDIRGLLPAGGKEKYDDAIKEMRNSLPAGW
ncbi:hypothetical protein [Kitasatospora sp. NPDC085879]|uniref:hypothetical protein n=1 Tax=Kitasatospora sp. NPDC085879 TaxID=3154769 RepID=UPI00342D7601